MKVNLVGCKVVEVRPMTKEETDREGWDLPATAIVFDNGTIIYPSRDEEGNGAGIFFGVKDNKQFSLY